MDDLLATHFAHLFIRDPIVVFNEDLISLDLDKVDHFENLQSTNWQHMRFKPPPPGSDIGWRVEVRPMEIQITDFENAAFSVFVVLITRAILSLDLNFYLPIQRTTENMETAHARDAVNKEKFYFRKNPFPTRSSRSTTNSGASTPILGTSRPQSPTPGNHNDTNHVLQHHFQQNLPSVQDEYEEMTINEIINGQSPSTSASTNSTPTKPHRKPFPGLIPLVETYLSSLNIDVETRCHIARYLALIRGRADGTLWTAARWIRHFVDQHEEYKHDSEVGEGVVYDLVKAVEGITRDEAKGNGVGWEMLGRGR